MREVMSFRLDAKAAEAARVRATTKGKKITAYLEDLVLSDLTAGPKSRPTLVEVIRLLRSNRAELEKIGIRHAEIFGSVARGEDLPDSDVDILVDLDPAIVRDLFAYSRVQRTLQDLVGRRVDIARRGRTRPELDAELIRDAVHAY
jgi:predicted nucleotidyltransferase